MKRGLVLVAALLVAGCASQPPRATASPLQAALNALLQGDAREALRVFDAIDAPLTSGQQALIDCVRARFTGPLPPNDLSPDASATLSAYETYWRAAMMNGESRAAAEARLLESLNAIPAMAGAHDRASLDSVSQYVVTMLEAEGLHALTGKTEPLYELMIWKSQETSVYDVALPEGMVNVKVVFLDKFASLGWGGFATCGVAQTGGCAKPDALYAVRASYDLASEDFRVSYLAHEGQHFADYAKYPMLEQPELEYRAKLTEIALSITTTEKLLSNFASLGGDSREAPHAFAARRVTLALQGVPLEGVRAAAAAKLRESTATMARLGAATTKRFLPD
ncbi:MAG TPA: hypothetical protein VF348_06035 [Usitatibacter sp.]